MQNTKKKSPVILIVILLLAVCFAGWFVMHWINNPSNQEAAQQAMQAQTGDGSGSGANAAEEGSGEPAQEQPKEDVNPAAQNVVIPEDAPDYAHDYPELYSSAISEPNVASEEKTVYLTFDDGPSDNTAPILDALKADGSKATFFVVASEINESNVDALRRVIDEGHTLGIHCNYHEYKKIYKSVDTFLEDFNDAYETIYKATGYRVQCFRFPGGSNNGVITGNKTYDAIIEEMTRRGFEYFDWNAYDGDAEGGWNKLSPKQMANRAFEEIGESSRNDVVVLMHDGLGKTTTAQAVPILLKRLRKAGYECKAIDNTTRPVHFYVNDNTPSDVVPEQPVETEDADKTETDGTATTEPAGSAE